MSTQGKYQEAEALQIEVLALQKSILGEDHPDTLNTSRQMAGTCRLQARYAEAEVFLTWA